jgi:hypothetical protein
MAIDLNDPVSIITVKAPQWASDTRIADLVELAELQTSSCFGDKYALAVALRVLHGLALEKMNGGLDDGTDSGNGQAGAVKSLKEGDLAEGRDTSSGLGSGGGSIAEAGLADTSYGRELISLSNAFFAGPINRFSGPCP